MAFTQRILSSARSSRTRHNFRRCDKLLPAAWTYAGGGGSRRARFGVGPLRRNYHRNNTNVGAVIGTPGTLPTLWSYNIANGLASQIVGYGWTADGVPYVDIRFFGNAAANGCSVLSEGTNAIATVVGDTWTGSAYYALVGGSMANVSSINHYVQTLDAGNNTIETHNTAITTNGTFNRVSLTTNVVTAGAAWVRSFFNFQTLAGNVDLTIRIGGSQLEKSSSVTPLILNNNVADTSTTATTNWPTSNLIAWSEDFTKFNGSLQLTVIPRAARAPDGQLTACKLVAKSTGGVTQHWLNSAVTLDANTTYTYSIFAKAGESTNLQAFLTGNFSNAGSATFNLATGVANCSTGTASMIAIGGGWYRCLWTFTTVTAGVGAIYAEIWQPGGGANFTGDDKSGMYVWGRQCNPGAAADAYTPSHAVPVLALAAPSNFVVNGTFNTDMGGWAAASSLAATAAVAAGEAQVTCTVAFGRMVQAVNLVPGATYTLSATARVISGAGSAAIGMCSATGGSLNPIIDATMFSAGATPIAVTFVAPQMMPCYVFIGTDASGTAGSVFGFDNVTLTEVSARATRLYLPGAFESVAAGTPRLDVNPTTGIGRGVLACAAATNLALWSEDMSQAANWSKSQVSVTQSACMFGGVIPYWTVAKTDTSSSRAMAQTIGNSAANTTYAYTLAMRAGSSSQASIGIGAIADAAQDPATWGGANYTTARIVSGPGAVANNLGLVTVTGLSATQDTLVEVTRHYLSAGVQFGIYVYPDGAGSVTLGASVLVTRFMCEVGSFGTDYIKTTNATATRAADVIACTDLTQLGYNANGYSTAISWDHGTIASTAVLALMTDVAVQNFLQLYINAANQLTVRVVVGGVQLVAQTLAGAYAANVRHRLCMAIMPTGINISVDGAAPTLVAAAVPLASFAACYLGSYSGSAINGVIADYTDWARVCANDELMAESAVA